MLAMFELCSALEKLDVTHFDTSKVENMNSIFSGCAGLTELDVTRFNTSNVTRMDSMFYDCAGLRELDLSSFKTSKYLKQLYSLFLVKVVFKITLSDEIFSNTISLVIFFKAFYCFFFIFAGIFFTYSKHFFY